ncbi:biopolymer transporter ExbD [candidate division KSB1 bacterium]|nr:biopolymer transporter ExbD [candidate division KSB1 bacterium]
MIVRLIDIVLIVLFGFMSISVIDINATLPLPAKINKIPEKKKLPPEVIEIEIDQSNHFKIGLFKIKNKRESYNTISNLELSVKKIREQIKRRDSKDIVILVSPHENSTVQTTVDVLDLCDRNDIPKNINKRSLALYRLVR